MKLEIISLLIGSIIGDQIFKNKPKNNGNGAKIPIMSKRKFEDEELLSKDFEDL